MQLEKKGEKESGRGRRGKERGGGGEGEGEERDAAVTSFTRSEERKSFFIT